MPTYLSRLIDYNTWANRGLLETTADLSGREAATMSEVELGTGRELFGMFRRFADEAEKGGSAMLAEGGL